MASSDQSFRSLGRELIDEFSRLIRQELRLAQAEGAEKLAQVQTGLIAIAVGLLLGTAALLVLLQAVVIGLAQVMPAWLAAVVVGVVVAGIGLGLVRYGQTNLKPRHLVPERTIRSVRADSDIPMGRTS